MSEAKGYQYLYNEGPSPFKPLMLIAVAMLGIAVPWYFSYEDVQEDFQEQWGLLMIVLPVLLLLALFYLASTPADSSVLNYVMPPSDPSSIHRVGGSPVGLGLLLLLILVMVWYHSDFMDSWNPLIRK